MACNKPLTGYRSLRVSKDPLTGEIKKDRSIVFNVREGYSDLPVTVPCGQCMGCRISRNRELAIRCAHEASLYENNCFLTLTYDDEHLPDFGSIVPEHPVLFMKRLRKRFGANIRSFGCAEYGEKHKRPHYHLLLFNFDFPDKEAIAKDKTGEHTYFKSEECNKLWKDGFHVIGGLDYESCAYVSRYVCKKITGKKQRSHYGTCSDLVTREERLVRLPEQSICRSRRPGIGKGWLELFHQDVYNYDYVVHNGKTFRTPAYYDSLFEKMYPDEFKGIKADRRINAKREKPDDYFQRLDAREKIMEIRFKQMKGILE